MILILTEEEHKNGVADELMTTCGIVAVWSGEHGAYNVIKNRYGNTGCAASVENMLAIQGKETGPY